MTEKIDVDKVNMYASVGTDFKLWTKEGGEQTIHLDEKMVFNAAKKEAALKVKFSGKDAPAYPGNCSKVSIANLPSPAQLSQMLKLIASSLGSKMTCGNDGTYDSWNLALTLPDKSIPIPQNNLTGTMKETMKLDKNGVIHSDIFKTDLHVTVPVLPFPNGTFPNGTSGKTTTLTEIDDMVMMSNGKTGGPSESDLDISDWGECTEIKPPPHAIDLLEELSTSLGTHKSFLPHMVSKTVFFRAIMQAAQQDVRSPASELVTV